MTEPPIDTPGESATSPLLSAAAAPPVTSPLLGIWERLKQHKVMQWTLAYAAAAYTLLHGVEMVSNSLSWPHIVSRVVTLVLILGVPIVATLAWYHGAKGLQKISGGELAIISLLGVIAGSALWALTGTSEHKVVSGATAASSAAGESAPAVAAAAAAPRTAIAVMPFANLTGDATKDYLGEGMAEELINTLTKVPGLRVPARTSTFSYRGRNPDAHQIAKDLKVGTILEGSVRSAGTTLRITAQLIDAQTDSHLWSESYDRKFTDLFKLQDDLARAIVQALQVNLQGASPASVIQAPPTQDLDAYQLYLRGASLADRVSEQNANRAISYFQQAIARDPKFARAYAGVGLAHGRLGTYLGQRPFEHLAAEDHAARLALTLDPGIALAYSELALVSGLRGNLQEAEVASLASLALGGKDALVAGFRAYHLMRVGRLRDALTWGRSAAELAPTNPLVLANLASFYSQTGRDVEALRNADLAIELGYPKDSAGLAPVYSDAALRAGHYAEAADLASKALNLSDPEQAQTAEVIRLVYAALANPEARARALGALERLYPSSTATGPGAVKLSNFGPCLESSFRYALLGDMDVAYGLANRCLDQRAPGAVYGGMSFQQQFWAPWLRPFHRDARFQAFATRLGIMDYWQQYGPPDDCELKDGKLSCR
jgi:TolB-like protein/Flp pilus assembly protein TadD